jgi:hypothetical protein
LPPGIQTTSTWTFGFWAFQMSATFCRSFSHAQYVSVTFSPGAAAGMTGSELTSLPPGAEHDARASVPAAANSGQLSGLGYV